MKVSSSLPWRIGLVLVLAGVFALPASFSSLGVRRLEARIDGASRLVSVTALDGSMCALPPPAPRATAGNAVIPVPVNPITMALALAQQGAAAPMPTDAQKAAVAARKPLRAIHDQYPMFSAVAVDAERNEVFLQDENLFQLMTFDRMTNTPPNAAFSEPKRSIKGPLTYLEFNCAIYDRPEDGQYLLAQQRHRTAHDRLRSGGARESAAVLEAAHAHGRLRPCG